MPYILLYSTLLLFSKVLAETTTVNSFFIRKFSSDASGHKCNNVFLKIIKFEANALQNKILITLILCSNPKY